MSANTAKRIKANSDDIFMVLFAAMCVGALVIVVGCLVNSDPQNVNSPILIGVGITLSAVVGMISLIIRECR